MFRIRRRGELGGTVIEILVATGIFMIALGAMFVLFQQSYQGFHFLEQRQSVQSQVLRIGSALEADFRLTNLASVGVQARAITVEGQTVSRDLTCCLTLDDWRDNANFFPDTGIPRWNRYAVYLCDLEDTGKLERATFTPSGSTAPLPVVPLPGLSSLPSTRITSRQLLCESLLSWRCEVDKGRQMVLQTLRLRQTGAKRGLDNNRTAESFEARFRWAPKNTMPRL